jgi:hypothetical protein
MIGPTAPFGHFIRYATARSTFANPLKLRIYLGYCQANGSRILSISATQTKRPVRAEKFAQPNNFRHLAIFLPDFRLRPCCKPTSLNYNDLQRTSANECNMNAAWFLCFKTAKWILRLRSCGQHKLHPALRLRRDTVNRHLLSIGPARPGHHIAMARHRGELRAMTERDCLVAAHKRFQLVILITKAAFDWTSLQTGLFPYSPASALWTVRPALASDMPALSLAEHAGIRCGASLRMASKPQLPRTRSSSVTISSS